MKTITICLAGCVMFLFSFNLLGNSGEGKGIYNEDRAEKAPVKDDKPAGKAGKRTKEDRKPGKDTQVGNPVKVKWVEEEGGVDCIRFEIKASKDRIAPGEEFELTVRMSFIEELPLSWRQSDCNHFSLQLVLPEGFVRTGGDYRDFLPVSLNERNKVREVKVRGHVEKGLKELSVMVLKGPEKSDEHTIFVKKREYFLEVRKDKYFEQSIKSDGKARSVTEECEFLSEVVLRGDTVCVRDTIQLFASGGVSYNWSGPNGFNSTLQNPFVLNAGVIDSGYYSVVIEDSASCSVTDSVIVIVNVMPLPPIISASKTFLLLTETATLTATGCSGIVNWSNGETGDSIIVSTDSVTAFTAVCTIGECVSGNSDTILIQICSKIKPHITGTIIVDSESGCEKISLMASGCGTQIVRWEIVSYGAPIYATDKPYNEPFIDFHAPNLYYNATCKFTTSSGICQSLKSEAYNSQGGYKELYITSDRDISRGGVIAPSYWTQGAFINICNGESITLMVSGCEGVVMWRISGVWFAGDSTQTFFPATAISSVSYYCQYGSCKTRQKGVDITMRPRPEPPILTASSSEICKGETVILYSYTPGSTLPIQWRPHLHTITNSSGESRILFTPTTSTIYSAKAYLNYGCQSYPSNLVFVTVHDSLPPIQTVIADKDTICALETVTLTSGTCNGTIQWEWTNTNGASGSLSADSISMALQYTTTYKSKCTNGCGTSANWSANKTIIVISVPPPVLSSDKSSLCGVPGGENTEEVTLTASGCAGTILWSTGSTGDTLTVTPLITDTYTAVCQSGGCVSAESNAIEISVSLPPASPAISILYGADSVKCAGDTTLITLNVDNCEGTLSWSTGDSTENISVNPLITTTYIAFCTNICGTASDTLTIFVTEAELDISLTAVSEIVCSGDTIQITATGGIGYAWTGPDSFVSSDSVIVITAASSINAGKYKVTVTNAGGCYASDSVNIAVKDFPEILLDGDTVCKGDTIRLYASGGLTYSWSGPDSFSSALASPVIPDAALTDSGYYQVIVTDSSGCSVKDSAYVQVNVPPSVTVSGDTVCQGQTIHLSASGGAAYSWTGPDDFTSEDQNPSVSNSTPINTGWYVVFVSDSNGCTVSDSVQVMVNEGPDAPAIAANKTLLAGEEEATLMATGCEGTVYWSNGMTGDTISVGTATQLLISAVCNVEGCVSDSSDFILLKNCVAFKPDLSASANHVNACTAVTFTSPALDDALYSWWFYYPNGTPAFWSLNSSSNSITVYLRQDYKVRVEVDLPACANLFSDSLLIDLNNEASVPVISTPDNLVQCDTGRLHLTASGCTGTVKWYRTTDLGTVIGEGSTFTTEAIAPASGQDKYGETYVAKCINGSCESDLSNALNLTVWKKRAAPVLSMTTPYYCAGQYPQISIVLPDGSSSNGNLVKWSDNSSQVIWSDSSGRTIYPSSFGTFTYKAFVSYYGDVCPSDTSNTVFFNITYETPATQTLSANLTAFCKHSGDTLVLNSATCIGEITWSQTTSGGSSTFTGPNPLVITQLDSTTTYKTKCTNGCATSASWSNEVTVTADSIPAISLSADTLLTAGDSLKIVLTAPGTLTYAWTGPGGFTSTLKNPVIPNVTLAHRGIYIVTATNASGCTVTDSIKIDIIEACECTACDAITDSNYADYPSVSETFTASGKNYIVENIYLKENTTSAIAQTVTYFDGMGRPLSKVVKQGAARQAGETTPKDIISFMEYDKFGREEKAYLPFTGSHTYGSVPALADLKTAQESFYNSLPGKSDDKSYAFSKKIMESSPLNRVIQQGSEGQKWQPGADDPENHTHRMIYTTNTKNNTDTSLVAQLANNVKWFRIDANAAVFEEQEVETGLYEGRRLFVNIITDENNYKSAEIKTLEGQVVCKRVQHEANGFIETNYVYDDLGLLRFVFQPMATQYLSTGTITPLDTTGNLHGYTFAYAYDARSRMIIKKVPGAARTEMVYDNLDQVVLTRDAWGVAKGRWLFTEYDALNRVSGSGYLLSSQSRAALQDLYDEDDVPSATIIYLQRNTYDAYPSGDAALFGASETFDQATLSNVQGLLVQTRTRIVSQDEDNDLWGNEIKTTSFFDAKGRAIKTVSTNHTGGTDVNVSKLDFAGKVIKNLSLTTYKKGESESDTVNILTKNSYDESGRLKTICHKVNEDNWERAVSHRYYPLGELNVKELGCDRSSGEELPLQKLEYTYNVKGWMLSVNDPVSGQLEVNKGLFGMRLAYDAGYTANENTTVSSKQFNGNISQQVWKALRRTGDTSSVHTYDYAYDRLSRLMKADYTGPNPTAIQVKMYDASHGYDLNGNIGYMERKTGSTVMDALVYSYHANRLTQIVDGGDQSKLFKDKDNPVDYTYDSGGNLTEDKNKDISLHYNHLNLPAEIARTDSGLIKHYYAGAAKVRMELFENDGSTLKKAYDYMAGMVYVQEGGIQTLDFISAPEGRLLPTHKILETTPDSVKGDRFRYEYTLRDHLGNTRVSCRCGDPKRGEDGTILTGEAAGTDSTLAVQINDYDPWGLSFGSDGETQMLKALTNRYQYNGKELQETGMYDYGARMYMPDIGRWGVVDPLADEPEQIDKSPYAAFWNNPIMYDDPDGQCPNCLTATIGAGIGALIGGGVEIATQLYNNGSVNNWSAVGGSALQGGITGAAAGFTGGASLLTTTVVAGGANAVGGAVNRATQGQGTTLKNIATDATVGAVLGAGGKLVSNAVSSGTNNLSRSAKGKLGEAVTEIKYGAQGYKSSGKAIVETGGKTATGKTAVAKYDHGMTNVFTGKKITVESKFNGSTLTPNQAAAQSRVKTAGGLIIDRTTSQGLGNGVKAATVGTGAGVDAQRNKRP